MGVEKTILQEGSGPQPEAGQTVIMGYTGWLKDTSKPENKGKKYVGELALRSASASMLPSALINFC